MLSEENPESVGLHPDRWQAVLNQARRWCDAGDIPAIGLAVGRGHHVTPPQLFGRQTLNQPSGSIREDAIFLIASITKPIVAMGLLLLVERGQLSLTDRVGDYLPGFLEAGKKGITIRHLLTHTSGLPDMLPENEQLRAEHARLGEFVRRTQDTDTAFAPGFGVQYQSMGFAVMGRLFELVTGKTAGEFLRDEVFQPLGMRDTALGQAHGVTGPLPSARIVEIRLPAELQHKDWNWNSDYWRQFGAPWGGLLTTPRDLARFASLMLHDGQWGGERIFSAATVQAATSNQLEAFRDVPAVERRTRGWGFGWRLNWPAHQHTFSDLLPPSAYGHFGATGTLLWIDPQRQTFALILTSEPLDNLGNKLNRLSSMIVAALR